MNTLLQLLGNNWKWIVGAAVGYSGRLFQDWLAFRRNKKSGLQKKKKSDRIFVISP